MTATLDTTSWSATWSVGRRPRGRRGRGCRAAAWSVLLVDLPAQPVLAHRLAVARHAAVEPEVGGGLDPHQHPDQARRSRATTSRRLRGRAGRPARRGGTRPSRPPASPSGSSGSCAPAASGARNASTVAARPGSPPQPCSSSSQWTTTTSSAAASSASASVVLPEPAGPSMQTSRPGPERRRRRAGPARARQLAATWGQTDVRRQVAAAVGRDHLGDRLAADQVHVADVLEQLARLGVPEPHQVADPQQRGGVPGQRGLHLAGTLEPREVQAGRRPRDGGAVLAGRAAGDEAAAVDGRHRRRGLAGHPEPEVRRRARLEGRVVVEDARAPAAPSRRRSR